MNTTSSSSGSGSKSIYSFLRRTSKMPFLPRSLNKNGCMGARVSCVWSTKYGYQLTWWLREIYIFPETFWWIKSAIYLEHTLHWDFNDKIIEVYGRCFLIDSGFSSEKQFRKWIASITVQYCIVNPIGFHGWYAVHKLYAVCTKFHHALQT